jgi:hypothetical protein
MKEKKDFAIPPIDHIVYKAQEYDSKTDPEIIDGLIENNVNLDKINVTY